LRIGVIDYGAGNLFSILACLKRLGFGVEVFDHSGSFQSDVDALILPGVGAYSVGMSELRSRGLIEPIRDFSSSQRPLVGICLGAQLLFQSSSEFGETLGLGLIPGHVASLSSLGFLPPTIGWRQVSWTSDTSLSEFESSWFYFVHSYHMVADNDSVVIGEALGSSMSYAAAVKVGSVFGFQFHPEKSGSAGSNLLGKVLRREH